MQLLLESGALAERNTFQGERCIYNALNDRIRNLLLQYDFSKSSDPYVYWSTHISSLLNHPANLTDISLIAGEQSFELHKFILAARTPYFRKKLQEKHTTSWKLANNIPVEAFQIALRYVYMGDLPRDLVGSNSAISEEEVVKGLDKISKDLEIEQLWEAILAGSDRRLARQRYEDEAQRAVRQISGFFQENVLGRKMVVDTEKVGDVKWNYDNSIFADIILRADEPFEDNDITTETKQPGSCIPIGPAPSPAPARKSVLYPAHKAMLIRSEYFEKMFSGDFIESQPTSTLRIVTVDCSPAILELILTFLYTESTDAITLDHALDLLYAADMLFLDTLKSKAAIAISTLGNGTVSDGALTDEAVEPVNIYDVIRAAWDLHVQRLEEFAARYLAYRLEDYIDEDDFQDVIKESAMRVKNREETDTIELLDDIRYYLGERFRLRFEDVGLNVIDGNGEMNAEVAADIAGLSLGEKNGEKKAEEEAGLILDGEAAEDEFASDAINYQTLLEKIDVMLEILKLDA